MNTITAKRGYNAVVKAGLSELLETAATQRAKSYAVTREYLKALRDAAAERSSGYTREIIQRGTANYGNTEGKPNCASFTLDGVTVCVQRDTAEVVA